MEDGGSLEYCCVGLDGVFLGEIGWGMGAHWDDLRYGCMGVLGVINRVDIAINVHGCWKGIETHSHRLEVVFYRWGLVSELVVVKRNRVNINELLQVGVIVHVTCNSWTCTR